MRRLRRRGGDAAGRRRFEGGGVAGLAWRRLARPSHQMSCAAWRLARPDRWSAALPHTCCASGFLGFLFCASDVFGFLSSCRCFFCPEADVAAARQRAQLLTWADGKLASDGSPEAATVQTKAAAAVAEFKALKKGASAPAAAAPVSAPVAAAPARVAPVLPRRRRQRARRTLRWPGRRHSCSPGRPTS